MYLEQDRLDNIMSLLESSLSSIEKFLQASPYIVSPVHAPPALRGTNGGTIVNIIQSPYLAQLYLLHQTSTVGEFQQQFEAIRTHVSSEQPELPEDFFTSLFINGLRPEVRTYVQGFNPCTVIDAYDVACIYEYSLRVGQAIPTEVVPSINLTDISGMQLFGYTMASADDGPKVSAAMETSLSCNHRDSNNLLVFRSSAYNAEVREQHVIPSIRGTSSSDNTMDVHVSSLGFQSSTPHNDLPLLEIVFLQGVAVISVIALSNLITIKDKGGTPIQVVYQGNPSPYTVNLAESSSPSATMILATSNAEVMEAMSDDIPKEVISSLTHQHATTILGKHMARDDEYITVIRFVNESARVMGPLNVAPGVHDDSIMSLTSQFRGSSGWLPPTQAFHCKYALFLLGVVTICNIVVNMDVPFVLLQHGLKAIAGAQWFIQHVLATVLACIIDWHLQPQGVVVFLLQIVRDCCCYHGCFPIASNSITYNMVTGRHKTELKRIHEKGTVSYAQFSLTSDVCVSWAKGGHYGLCTASATQRVSVQYQGRVSIQVTNFMESRDTMWCYISSSCSVQHVLFGCLVNISSFVSIGIGSLLNYVPATWAISLCYWPPDVVPHFQNMVGFDLTPSSYSSLCPSSCMFATKYCVLCFDPGIVSIISVPTYAEGPSKFHYNKFTKLVVVLNIKGLPVSKAHFEEHNAQPNEFFPPFHFLLPKECTSNTVIMANDLVACSTIDDIRHHYYNGFRVWYGRLVRSDRFLPIAAGYVIEGHIIFPTMIAAKGESVLLMGPANVNYLELILTRTNINFRPVFHYLLYGNAVIVPAYIIHSAAHICKSSLYLRCTIFFGHRMQLIYLWLVDLLPIQLVTIPHKWKLWAYYCLLFFSIWPAMECYLVFDPVFSSSFWFMIGITMGLLSLFILLPSSHFDCTNAALVLNNTSFPINIGTDRHTGMNISTDIVIEPDEVCNSSLVSAPNPRNVVAPHSKCKGGVLHSDMGTDVEKPSEDKHLTVVYNGLPEELSLALHCIAHSFIATQLHIRGASVKARFSDFLMGILVSVLAWIIIYTLSCSEHAHLMMHLRLDAMATAVGQVKTSLHEHGAAQHDDSNMLLISRFFNCKFSYIEQAFVNGAASLAKIAKTWTFGGLLPILANTILMHYSWFQLQIFTVQQVAFLKHIGMGLLLASGSMTVVAVVEVRGRAAAKPHLPLSIFWLAWQYLLIATHSVLFLHGDTLSAPPIVQFSSGAAYMAWLCIVAAGSW